MQPLIPLREVNRQSLPEVGGKAANLGELLRAGFNVPDGFCVTTGAYRRIAAGLASRMAELVACLERPDVTNVPEIARQIRTLFLQASMPEDLATQIWEAALALGEQRWAVRSSAVAEDLPEASFAGQMESYLEISGHDALLEAVNKCWASLWTDRAVNYRLHNHISSSGAELAVIVQRMVSADVAGVMFTANPLSGKRTEITIESSFGLGEAVVKGLVTPDSYIVDKRSLEIVLRRANLKSTKVVGHIVGGTAEADVEDGAATALSLSDQDVLALARTGVDVEEHFCWPQDVEWALAADQLWLVQSRPITSLYPAPPLTPAEDLRVYLSLNAVQGIVEPFTPVGASAFIGLAERTFGRLSDRPPLIVLGGRLFIDITPLLRHPLFSQVPRVLLPQIDPLAAASIAKLAGDKRVRAAPASRRRLALAAFRRLPQVLPVALRVLGFVLLPERAQRHLHQFIIPRLGALRESTYRKGKNSSFRELLGDMSGALRTLFFPGLFPLVASGMLCLALSQMLVRRWGLDSSLLLRVRQGLPNNKTTIMDLALWQHAQRVREDSPSRDALLAGEPSRLAGDYFRGELPALLRGEMESFLRDYGHRGIREIDFGMPCWRDDPAYLFGVLRSFLSIDPEMAPDKHFVAQAIAADQAIASLLAQARRSRLGRWKSLLLGFLLARYRQLGGLRETPKFYAVWLFQALRDSIRASGGRLAEVGALDHADDVRFLTLEEIENGSGCSALRELVAERRHLYQREMGRARPPRVLTSEGETFYGESLSRSDNELVGTGVSPGVAEGPARVVRVPAEASLAPGEILVAPSTDPAWTPLFLTAGGLIMEAGGMMSHGAIVAREYGIPAVVGVPRATEFIKTGQRLQVDGNQGLVKMH